MRKKKIPEINVGYLEVPETYHQFTQDEKNVLCDKIIDALLTQLDRHLLPHINRITFLEEILESSLLTNELDENYEICSVIKDCQRRLNEA